MKASAMKSTIFASSGGLPPLLDAAPELLRPNNLFPTISTNSGGAFNSSQMKRNLVISVLIVLSFELCVCSDSLSHCSSTEKSATLSTNEPWREFCDCSSSCLISNNTSLKMERNKLNGTLESPSLLILRVTITRFFIFFTIALTRSVD